MTVPPTYNRQFNFTNYQAVNPATPLPATPLDTELSSVKVTLDALISNLSLIQRSDGQVANASIGPQQLQASVLASMSPPTQWTGASFSYDVGDTVFSGLLFYVCNTANISSNANPPATFAAWSLLADFSGVTISPGSVTSAAFAPGAVNSAALGANLALPGSPTTGDNSTAIATTAFVDAQAASMLTGYKNKIINGAMAIDQRNGGASGTAAAYTADRWQYASTQTGKVTWQRVASSGLPQFPFCLQATGNGAYSPISTDHFNFNMTIEAFDVSDLQWGTASAQPVTLSFWVKASATGSYGGALRNSGSTRSYVFGFSVVAANTWQQISVSLVGDTSGTWQSGSTFAGLVVSFNLGCGSGLIGVGGAWAAGNFISDSPGSSGIIGGTGTIQFTGVSLQVGGGAATAPFEFRPYAVELALCQRYYETQAADIISGNVTSTGTYRKYSGFAVAKRVAPTVTFSGITASGFATAVTVNTPTVAGIKWGAVSNATTTGGFLSATWAADAEF